MTECEEHHIQDKVVRLFADTQQEVLAQCKAALQSVVQTCADYEREIVVAEGERANGEITANFAYATVDVQSEMLQSCKEVLLQRRQLRLAKYKWAQIKQDDIPVLAEIQQLIEDQQYNEVIRLTEEYHEVLAAHEPDMLKHLHREQCFRDVQEVVSGIAEKLNMTLKEVLEHINNFWFKADDTHDEAQYLLEHEVLIRYPDHPKVREVQRGWARHDIKQGLEQDSQDYTALGEQIQALQFAFWSADEAEQTWAVATAYDLDLDALVTSPGLERAAAAVERLSELSPSNDLTLQQIQLEVREQRTLRQLLRLLTMLYRNDLGQFDQEMRDVLDQGLLLQDVRKLGDEHAAVIKMQEALVAFENGDWQRTWAAARAARSSYPGAPRIDVLIERAEHAAQTQVRLGDQIRQTLSDLLTLEHMPDMTGTKLAQINAQIQEFKQQIDQYTYFARKYTGQYTELQERYQTCWHQAATHAFESRRLNVADDPHAIEELERLVDIAPRAHEIGTLIQQLQGRVEVLRARQMIGDACLHQADEHVRAATSMLPPDDQLFQEVRDTLRQKLTFVHFSRHQATTYMQQHELTSAHRSIVEALDNNKEDQEAEAIREALEAEMRAVQELADQAYALVGKDLPRALALWQEVCRRHTDGTYPPANARPFTEWQKEVNQLIVTSRERIEQARIEFQNLRDWLTGRRRPVWEDFSTYCQHVLENLSKVEPGMRQEHLFRLEAAVHLLERYRDTYQQLEIVLRPGTGHLVDVPTREQAIQEFQTVRAEMLAFHGMEDKLLEDLAPVIQASYDRMDRIIRYI